MAIDDNGGAQTVTINAPEGFQYEAGKPIQVPIESIDFKTLVPKDYGEKDYMKKVGDLPSLFKSFDGLQTLVGRPYRTPEADAPKEEWDKFYAALRPEKSDMYEFDQAPEGIPDELKAGPEFQSQVKAIFHEAGITKPQAKILQTKWDALMLAQHKAALAENEKKKEAADTQFNELMTKTFGDKKDAVVNDARRVMIHLMGEKSPYLSLLDKATNEQLVGIVAMMKTLKEKYIKEDELPNGSGANPGNALSDLQAKLFELRKEEDAILAKNETMSPRLQDILKEKASLAQQIAKLAV